MASKSTPADENVFLFIPNLIGYCRIILAGAAVYCMSLHPKTCMLVYSISQLLDAVDGQAARYFNQCSKFGAVLDMVTDRCTTACLLCFLASAYPSYALVFQFLIALDVSSHYMHMYSSLTSGATSHKKISETSNIFLRLYYSNNNVLFAVCFADQLFFVILYLFAFDFQNSTFGLVLYLLAIVTGPICVGKQVHYFIHTQTIIVFLALLHCVQVDHPPPARMPRTASLAQLQSHLHNSSLSHFHQHQNQYPLQAMPSNHGSSQYLYQSQQSAGGNNSSYNLQAQGGSIDASIVPRQTQGDRMTCIVNASITCIPSSATVSSQPSFSSLATVRNNAHQDSSYISNTTSSNSRAGSSQGYYRGQNRHDDHERLQLYVFGGFHQYTDAVNNDLYRLDIETMLWERLAYTKGEPPSKRNDHSASLWGDDRIIIFGGSDERNQYCNDVQILHVRTLTWESPEVSGIIPSGRVKHAATIMNDRLYISGGCLEHEGVSQELLCLNLLTWEWEEPIDFVPRYRHTLFMHRGKLFAYGGYNEELDRTGVIAYMDLDTNQVTKINVSNEIAPNVAAQQFSQVCGNHLVVVISQGVPHELQKFTGGIWTLNLDCFQWTMHDDWKILGESHTWHYFSMERDGDQFYLIGDINDSDEYFNQVLTIDMREYGSFQEPEVAMGYELGRLLQDQISLADFRIICTGTDAQVNAAVQSVGAVGPFSGYYAPSDSSGDHDMMIDNHPMILNQRVLSQRQTPSTSRATSPQQEPIMCHKLILLARWPHFASMVQSGMLEAQTSTLTLPEPYETVKAFIEFLYTDSIEGMSTDTIADLLVMGSMYVMKRLIQLCSSVLHQQIDIETVSRIYHRAGLSGQIGLRQRALKFMFRNYGPVSKTTGFRSLPKEALFDFWDSTPEGAVINVAL
ncbi:hypothetical protein BGX27_009107 [Mortierella sp. AM989]|nr:hypothetical protein BGX27_009107 [Mortierella sp. AM989]